jgi:hypothetical protein
MKNHSIEGLDYGVTLEAADYAAGAVSVVNADGRFPRYLSAVGGAVAVEYWLDDTTSPTKVTQVIPEGHLAAPLPVSRVAAVLSLAAGTTAESVCVWY